MFDVVLKAGTLRDLIVPVLSISEEVVLVCDKTGISIRSADNTHVTMVDVKLGKDAFEKYDVSSGFCLALDIGKLRDILKLTTPDADIILKWSDKTNKLNLKTGNIRRHMALLKDDGKRVTIPEFELPTRFKISVESFMKALKGVETVTDQISFHVEDGVVLIKGSSDTDEVEARFEGKYLEELDGTDAKSMYSLDYIWKLAKGLVGDFVKMELGDNFPLRMNFEFANGHGSAMYMVAPRLEA